MTDVRVEGGDALAEALGEGIVKLRRIYPFCGRNPPAPKREIKDLEVAEQTGIGVELGGGIRYSRGPVSIEGQVRALVAHEDSGYKEWGAKRGHPGAAERLRPSLSVQCPSRRTKDRTRVRTRFVQKCTLSARAEAARADEVIERLPGHPGDLGDRALRDPEPEESADLVLFAVEA